MCPNSGGEWGKEGGGGGIVAVRGSTQLFLGLPSEFCFPRSEVLPVVRIFPGLDERTVKLADVPVFRADVFNKAAH